MSVENRTALIRNAAIAAIVGSTVGGATGLWSVRHPAATITMAAPAAPVTVATEAANSPKVDVTAGSPQPHPQPLPPVPESAERRSNKAARLVPDPVAATVTSAATPARSAGTTEDDEHVLQRARALARRPDVPALLALREGVVRRAAERGLADSPSIKGELDELDQRLDEARQLRLKLDAEEFRKSDSKRPR
jgi:hypothetical protein